MVSCKTKKHYAICEVDVSAEVFDEMAKAVKSIFSKNFDEAQEFFDKLLEKMNNEIEKIDRDVYYDGFAGFFKSGNKVYALYIHTNEMEKDGSLLNKVVSELKANGINNVVTAVRGTWDVLPIRDAIINAFP